MDDQRKTKQELIRELEQLRSQVNQPDQLVNAPPQTIQQLQSLTHAAQSLLEVHDLASLWVRVATAVQNILNPSRHAIFLYNPEADALTCPHAAGLSQKYINKVCKDFQKTPHKQKFYELEPLWSEDAQTDPIFAGRNVWAIEEGIHSLALFPLSDNQGVAIGALGLYWDEIRPLPPTFINTGHTLAHMIALALNTITLFNEAKLNLQREQQLNAISQTLNAATELPTLLGSLLQMVADLVHADGGLLGLIIDREMLTFYPYNVPHWMSLRPAPRPRGLAWHIITTCEPILIDDYSNHPEAMEKWIEAGVSKFLGVPLRAGDNCLGMISLFNLNSSRLTFNERDLDLVASIGKQAGIAIQNLRQLAEAQQRAAAMAAALNRQAELDILKNNFTQSVSHELRSPLGIIYGHAELLVSEVLGSLNDEQKQSGEIIMRRVLMLTNLVDDLTALLAAETQEFRREQIDTTLLIYSLLADYRMRAEELGILLEADIEESIPWVMGDSTHLRRVFDNLVSNAFKFTPAGGQITLRLKAIGHDVHIQVADSGEGIPEDKVGRIFERFYQVDGGSTRRHKGTGLGLSLVKEIVEAHRGTVSVQSTVGKGTTFTILIPGFRPE